MKEKSTLLRIILMQTEKVCNGLSDFSALDHTILFLYFLQKSMLACCYIVKRIFNVLCFYFDHGFYTFFYLSKLFSFKHQPRWYSYKRPAKWDPESSLKLLPSRDSSVSWQHLCTRVMLWLSILNHTLSFKIFFSLFFYDFNLLKFKLKNIQPYNLYRLYSDVAMEEMEIRNDRVASPILSDVSSGYPATNSKLSFDTGNPSW